MKKKVVVYFQASKEIEVEVPTDILDVVEYVQQELESDLPEVVEGCEFMFPISGEVDGEEFDLGKDAG